MTRSRHVVIAVVAALATAAGAAGCKKPKAKETAAASPPVQLAPEDVVKVTKGTIETGPRLAGTLEARERAVVRAEVGGTVTAIGPELGETVNKGDLLVRIETGALGAAVQTAQAGVPAAQAQVDVAKKEVERMEALVAGGAVAQRDLDRARAALVAAQAQLNAARSQVSGAQSQLGNTVVKAPMAGAVAQRPVNAGDVVTPGSLLYEIIVPATMRLSGTIGSEDLGEVGLGKPVVFEVRGYPGQKFEGSITRIAPSADPVTRQIAVIVDIPNPGGKLVAGLYADGRVATEQHAALIVPTSAVEFSGDRPTVLRARNGVAERVPIATGLRDDRKEVVEVTSGLAEGDVLIFSRAGKDIGVGTKVVPPGDATANAEKPADKPAEKH